MKEAQIKLKVDQPELLRGNILRRAICALFPNEPIFSQHAEDGTNIYTYPLIQYRVTKRDGAVVYGINEGADVLVEKVYPQLQGELKICPTYKDTSNIVRLKIIYKSINMTDSNMEPVIGKTRVYSTVTPLLLLDTKERLDIFTSAGPEDKARLLQKWMVNNLAHIFRKLNMPIAQPIKVPFIELSPVNVRKKGILMTGLAGHFATNIRIGKLGIGHYSSHGYGVVKETTGGGRTQQ